MRAMASPRSLSVSKVPDDAEYCTVPEAAALLRVNSSTVWRWIAAGKLPAYRVGLRSIRIKRRHLDLIVTPVNAEASSADKERDLWAGYSPSRVRRALAKTAGAWADLDADALIASLYRARKEGSRTSTRP